ncbi:MAG: TlpA family protein disulfide reductase [Chitinophagaceae bacterium]|nr:TlpA family protein disulfide reductase [Chitinophagaceae bacterium]
MFSVIVILSSVLSMLQPPKELHVGDLMPDISLGKVMNNKTGKMSFAQFKGRLVILDFWDTNCGYCIAGFPKMEKLQRQFGDSIQVILVNITQTQKEITAIMKERHTTFPDLPCITEAKLLGQLFPHRYSGGTAWIDPSGRVCLRGHPFNNHPKKIRELLSGKPISWMLDGETYEGQPYSDSNKAPLMSGNFFPYEPVYAGNDSRVLHVIDSSRQTVRNTFINYTMFNFAEFVFLKELLEMMEHRISGYRNSQADLEFFEVNLKDTLKYTTSFIPRGMVDSLQTDESWCRTAFCYEQILPASASEEIQSRKIRQDLEQFLETRFGARLSLETKTVNCYQLVRTDTTTSILSAPSSQKGNLLRLIVSKRSSRSFLKNHLFMDMTGYRGKVNLLLPEGKAASLEQLCKELRPYKLNVIFGPCPVTMVCIKDN